MIEPIDRRHFYEDAALLRRLRDIARVHAIGILVRVELIRRVAEEQEPFFLFGEIGMASLGLGVFLVHEIHALGDVVGDGDGA